MLPSFVNVGEHSDRSGTEPLTNEPTHTSLRHLLARPLGIEGSKERDERRCRLVFTVPIAVFIGSVLGGLAVGRLGVEPLWAISLGALVLGIIAYLATLLESVLSAFLASRGADSEMLVELVVDAAAGALVGHIAALVLDTSSLVGVGVGSAVGGAYSFVASQLLCRGVGEAAVGSLFGFAAVAGRHRTDLSHPDSLAARGLYEAAVSAFEECIGEDPANPAPYLRIARLLRAEMEQPREALRWYRRAMAEGRVEEGEGLAITRAILDLCETELEAPEKAAPDVARLAARFPDSRAGRWARETLPELKGHIAAPEGRGGTGPEPPGDELRTERRDASHRNEG